MNCSTAEFEKNSILDDQARATYEYVYRSSEGKVILYSCIFVISLLGPVLCGGIIMYENYGGDRQKRTILNRLFSLILYNMIVYAIFKGILRIVRDINGLYDYDLALWFDFVCRTLKLNICLLYNQLTIIRFLYILVWKRMRVINDDLWTAFLRRTTFLVSGFTTTIPFMIGCKPNKIFFLSFAMIRNEVERENVHADR